MRDFLLKHADSHPVSFHMPGHKGSEIFRKYGYGQFLDRFVDCDITEIPGADNLFQAEGIIRETCEKYAKLYGVDKSYLMVNGTSGALIASVLASVRPGHKLIMARNCHKSVFNALTLGNIQPVYAAPRFIEEYGIMGEIPPEEIKKCIEANPDADAVILPSPNYYGICSDIRAIAEICHERGKILIVDQAHGAHLRFFHSFGYGEGMPRDAESAGADLVAGSIHKTLASLTQSAVLNLQGNLVDRYALEDRLQAIESSSPSYILMSFLDINADLLADHGREAIGAWRDAVEYFYEGAKNIPGLSLLKAGSMDRTKINLDMSALGIDGAELEKLLIEKNIFTELYTGDILMLMTGIGNTRADMEKTLTALREIAERSGKAAGAGSTGTCRISKVPGAGKLFEVPKKKEFVPLKDAAGRICAGSIIPYPPGIPVVCPGEEITAEMVEYIAELRERGEKVIGVNEEKQVAVGKR